MGLGDKGGRRVSSKKQADAGRSSGAARAPGGHGGPERSSSARAALSRSQLRADRSSDRPVKERSSVAGRRDSTGPRSSSVDRSLRHPPKERSGDARRT